MDLTGINVLIDGYNLQLPQGSGIKTYGMSLIRALNSLNAKTNVLYSSHGGVKDPVLEEILFFDRPNGRLSIKNGLRSVLSNVSSNVYKAGKVNITGKVIPNNKIDTLGLEGIFSLKDCYQLANLIYRKIDLKTNISIPGRVDIWHETYPLPINIEGAKKITTVHDLIPLKLPYTTLDDKKFFYKTIKNSIESSEVVISVSENTKNDILTFFDVDPSKIFVTYQPLAIDSSEINEDKVFNALRKYKLDFHKYLLFVGVIEPKKNVGRLLNAYAAIDTDMPIAIVGKKGWLWENEIGNILERLGKKVSRRIKFIDYVSAEDLRILYSGAYCLIFPSIYEGFGLPVLEAMSFGCPVITSNVSSLPEICQEAGLYVDPYSVSDIQDKIEKLLSDSLLRSKLSDLSSKRANFFNMENYVSRLYKAYEKLL